MWPALLLAALAATLSLSAPAQTEPPPVQVWFVGAELTLFPTPTEPAQVTVRAMKAIPDHVRLQCRAVVDNLTTAPTAGYFASPPVTLDLVEIGEIYEASIQFWAETDAPPMTTGKVLVVGNAGGQQVRSEAPIRLGRGALAFCEPRLVAFESGPRKVDVACLENSLLRAEFIPELGCLSALYSHRTRRDLLVEGDYPLGFFWSGLTGWYHKSFSSPGSVVSSEFTTRAQGGKVLMRATLGETDDHLDIIIDAGELQTPPGPVYLMSTATAAGGDLVHVPTASSPEGIAPTSQVRRLSIQGFSAPWLGLWSCGFNETLEVAFSVPTLYEVQIGAQPPWYNYASFHLREGCPGTLAFRFRVAPGRTR